MTDRDQIRAAMAAAIVEVIDAPGHHCAADSEGQRCCIDPRPQEWVWGFQSGKRPGNGEPGDAIAEGLLERLVDIAMAAIKP